MPTKEQIRDAANVALTYQDSIASADIHRMLGQIMFCVKITDDGRTESVVPRSENFKEQVDILKDRLASCLERGFISSDQKRDIVTVIHRIMDINREMGGAPLLEGDLNALEELVMGARKSKAKSKGHKATKSVKERRQQILAVLHRIEHPVLVGFRDMKEFLQRHVPEGAELADDTFSAITDCLGVEQVFASMFPNTDIKEVVQNDAGVSIGFQGETMRMAAECAGYSGCGSCGCQRGA